MTDQVKKEFEPRAIERIKSSMSLGKLAEIEKIEITPEEIAEYKRLKGMQ